MTESINNDISQTLRKLETLLEYSTSPLAEEVLVLVTNARRIWEDKDEEDYLE